MEVLHDDTLLKESVKNELLFRFSRKGIWRQRLRWIILRLFWILTLQISLGLKRLVDILMASILLILFSPLMAGSCLFLKTQRKGFKRIPRLGRWGIIFNELSLDFNNDYGFVVRFLSRMPILLNIFRGDVSFIGPRLVSVGDLSLRQRAVQKKLNVRPGIVCLWWIRKRSNIDYGPELEMDAEYVDSHSLSGDMGIALRAIPALLYGEGVVTATDTVNILGIHINNITLSETVEEIIKYLDGRENHQLCFLNADCVNIACRDEEYLKILHESEMVLADGIGLKLAGKLLGRDIKQNVNGTDIFPHLCKALSGKALSGKALSGSNYGLFLLGGRPGIPERVINWINENYPDVVVKGFHHGYFSPEEEKMIIKKIKNSKAGLLLVARGAPSQEKWISRNINKTGVKVGIGVGGLFDFYSGRISRAPHWIREIGMEWAYRFYQEPKRMWKRYLWGNFIFLLRVLKEKLYPFTVSGSRFKVFKANR